MKKFLKISLIVILFLFVFYMIGNICFIGNDIVQSSIKSDSLLIGTTDLMLGTKSKADKNNIELFIQVLSEDRDSRKPWIERKEISAWAATILYFTIIMILFTNIKVLKTKRYSIPILFLILLLFGLFIHQQYGGLVNGMAVQNAINIWIYNAIQENKIPDNFDFTIIDENNLPKSIMDSVSVYQAYIRQHKICFRVLLPYSFILSKGLNLDWSFNTVEIEESILYNVILISTLAFIYIMKNTKTDM